MADDYLWFEGIPLIPKYHTPEHLRQVNEKFIMRDEDTAIVAYPKSGTHWLVEIVGLIQANGDARWVQSVPFWKRSPWIEHDFRYQHLVNMQGPRLFATHLPIQLFPKSFFRTKAKVIHLIRNPKDILVSGYYFWQGTEFIKIPESLEEFFEWFIQGHVPYGAWFDHTCGWLSMRERENLLLLSYEELLKDRRSAVEKICQFLGKKLEPEELDLVIKNSSFQVMKDNKMPNLQQFHFIRPGFTFMRKGICGDWKNHFTAAQAEAFDKMFQEKMAGFPQGLFPWLDYPPPSAS